MNRKEKFAIPVDAMVMIREPGFVVVARLNILEKINQISSKPESFCFRLSGALYIILPHYWCQFFAFFTRPLNITYTASLNLKQQMLHTKSTDLE